MAKDICENPDLGSSDTSRSPLMTQTFDTAISMKHSSCGEIADTKASNEMCVAKTAIDRSKTLRSEALPDEKLDHNSTVSTDNDQHEWSQTRLREIQLIESSEDTNDSERLEDSVSIDHTLKPINDYGAKSRLAGESVVRSQGLTPQDSLEAAGDTTIPRRFVYVPDEPVEARFSFTPGPAYRSRVQGEEQQTDVMHCESDTVATSVSKPLHSHTSNDAAKASKCSVEIISEEQDRPQGIHVHPQSNELRKGLANQTSKRPAKFIIEKGSRSGINYGFHPNIAMELDDTPVISQKRLWTEKKTEGPPFPEQVDSETKKTSSILDLVAKEKETLGVPGLPQNNVQQLRSNEASNSRSTTLQKSNFRISQEPEILPDSSQSHASNVQVLPQTQKRAILRFRNGNSEATDNIFDSQVMVTQPPSPAHSHVNLRTAGKESKSKTPLHMNSKDILSTFLWAKKLEEKEHFRVLEELQQYKEALSITESQATTLARDMEASEAMNSMYKNSLAHWTNNLKGLNEAQRRLNQELKNQKRETELLRKERKREREQRTEEYKLQVEAIKDDYERIMTARDEVTKQEIAKLQKQLSSNEEKLENKMLELNQQRELRYELQKQLEHQARTTDLDQHLRDLHSAFESKMNNQGALITTVTSNGSVIQEQFEECLKALSTVKNSETKAVSLIGDVINAVENLSERLQSHLQEPQEHATTTDQQAALVTLRILEQKLDALQTTHVQLQDLQSSLARSDAQKARLEVLVQARDDQILCMKSDREIRAAELNTEKTTIQNLLTELELSHANASLASRLQKELEGLKPLYSESEQNLKSAKEDAERAEKLLQSETQEKMNCQLLLSEAESNYHSLETLRKDLSLQLEAKDSQRVAAEAELQKHHSNKHMMDTEILKDEIRVLSKACTSQQEACSALQDQLLMEKETNTLVRQSLLFAQVERDEAQIASRKSEEIISSLKAENRSVTKLRDELQFLKDSSNVLESKLQFVLDSTEKFRDTSQTVPDVSRILSNTLLVGQSQGLERELLMLRSQNRNDLAMKVALTQFCTERQWLTEGQSLESLVQDVYRSNFSNHKEHGSDEHERAGKTSSDGCLDGATKTKTPEETRAVTKSYSFCEEGLRLPSLKSIMLNEVRPIKKLVRWRDHSSDSGQSVSNMDRLSEDSRHIRKTLSPTVDFFGEIAVPNSQQYSPNVNMIANKTSIAAVCGQRGNVAKGDLSSTDSSTIRNTCTDGVPVTTAGSKKSPAENLSPADGTRASKTSAKVNDQVLTKPESSSPLSDLPSDLTEQYEVDLKQLLQNTQSPKSVGLDYSPREAAKDAVSDSPQPHHNDIYDDLERSRLNNGRVRGGQQLLQPSETSMAISGHKSQKLKRLYSFNGSLQAAELQGDGRLTGKIKPLKSALKQSKQPESFKSATSSMLQIQDASDIENTFASHQVISRTLTLRKAPDVGRYSRIAEGAPTRRRELATQDRTPTRQNSSRRLAKPQHPIRSPSKRKISRLEDHNLSKRSKL